MPGLQDLTIHPGPVIKSVHVAFGHDLHQILIALVILRQKDQMIVPVLPSYGLPVKPGTGGHIDLTADNGLDPRLFSRPVKIDHPIHGSVIRDRHTVHAQFFRPRRQLPDLAGTV